MSFSINRATLVGNLGKDPEIRYTPTGNAVCNFSVCTNNSIKQGDEWKEIPTFHNIVVWGKKAEFCAQNLHKGSKVYVEGRIDNRSYEDKNGIRKYISEVVANEVIPMQGKSSQSDDSTPTENTQKVELDDIDLGADFDNFLNEQDKPKQTQAKVTEKQPEEAKEAEDLDSALGL